MISKKAVFTDIDGTLLRGFISIDFVEYLFEKNLFNKCAYEQQKILMKEYKNKSIGYLPWLEKWAGLWAKGLSGYKQREILNAAQDFFPRFKDKIYTSSKLLVQKFHEKEYLVVGVSVGAVEAINLVKEYLLMDFAFGSELRVINGLYAPEVISKMHTDSGKIEKLKRFSLENNIDLSNSISIGDTAHDTQMLGITGKKVALNPTQELLEIANEQGFLVANFNNVLDKIDSIM